MTEFIICAVVAAIIWPAVITWWHHLQATDAMAPYRPTAKQVAATERAHLPGHLL